MSETPVKYIKVNPAILLEAVNLAKKLKQEYQDKNGTTKLTPEQKEHLRSIIEMGFAGEDEITIPPESETPHV